MPGCFAYRYLVDGEWHNAQDAEVEKDEEGKLVSLLLVEEEEVKGFTENIDDKQNVKNPEVKRKTSSGSV